jgi:tetratricopeptide (TPR) repeat protein
VTAVESARNRDDLWAAVGLAALTITLYAQVARHDFVRFDDYAYIVDNPMVGAGLTWDGIRWAFASSAQSNWHPLTWLSHMLDVELFGLAPGGHHLTSVLLHAVSAAVLFAAFRVMTGAYWPSLLTAALFAVHPLRVESVAWAAERKDVLAGLFWMLTLLAYGLYARKPGFGRYLGVVVFMALGLMAKPMLVTLPFVLLLLDVWPLNRWRSRERGPAGPVSRLVLEKVPLLVLTGLSTVVTIVVQRAGGAVQNLEGLPLWARLANAPVAYVSYLVKTLWPRGLAFYYPHPAIVSDDPLDALLLPSLATAGLLAAITVWGWRVGRHRPHLLVGWLWYLGTLVPVIGIVQVGNQAFADRYAYLPLVGIYLMIAWTVSDLAARSPALRRTLAAGAVIVVALLSATTWGQIRHWRNSVTLFEHAIRVTRDNYVAHNNLGNELARRGDLAEAVRHYEIALRIKPDLSQAHNNLGSTLSRQGETAQAATHFQEATRLDPGYATAHYNLATALERLGSPVQAMARYERALRLDPTLAEAHERLGHLLASSGRPSDAVDHYRRALDRKPELLGAARGLAWLLATSDDPEIRDGSEAVRWAEHAARAAGVDDPIALDVLAAAHAESGDFAQSIRLQKRALERAPEGLKDEFRSRLELYRSGKPFRTPSDEGITENDGDALEEPGR